MKKRYFIYTSIITLIILAITAIAMQFTDQVDWSLADFGVASILLFSFLMLILWIYATPYSLRKKLLFIMLALAALLLVWAELAVGIFGSPLAGS